MNVWDAKEMPIAIEISGQLQPGAQVPVKVDPSDHSQLMIGLAG